MPDTPSTSTQCVGKIIWVPALVTLAVTLLRLIGELLHWSPTLFNPAPGGGGAIVGISWLPVIFGPYFALRLARTNEGPEGYGKAVGFTVLGLLLAISGMFIGYAPQIKIPGKAFLGNVIMAIGALLPLLGWRSLWKALLAYAYAARIPVAIVMFFAMRGNWGTHYDAVPRGYPASESFWAKYLQLAIAPQLIFWVVFTILVGALLGSLVAAVAHRKKPVP